MMMQCGSITISFFMPMLEQCGGKSGSRFYNFENVISNSTNTRIHILVVNQTYLLHFLP